MAASSSTREPITVLVVDDNKDTADSLAQWLRLSGHRVEVAYSGLSALASVRSLQPDVVVCDLGLPEITGYDFALAVRRESARGIRLVAHSGYDRPDEVSKCMECGFDAHVPKPSPPAYIERMLRATTH
ncbi:MAG: sensor hybrid histidine kinase [Burkholderiales bacterium]|jgi:CheY-like chemotaxis protein|nr:sensor hybrid histidine kinase [Burkholderiales bacterium]